MACHSHSSFQSDPGLFRFAPDAINTRRRDGGVFVAGSLVWGMVLDGFRPDRYDVTGALVCLVGVAIIMYTPRNA